jgi:hypothetical protein
VEARRETNQDLINRIANSAAVRPFVCYRDGPMDWSPAIEGCIVLSCGDDAVGVFEQTHPGVFQTHTMFGPTCRGRRAIEAARAMIDWMIPQHAVAIWGATPVVNRAARWFNRQLGAVSIGFDDFEAEGQVEIFLLRRLH